MKTLSGAIDFGTTAVKGRLLDADGQIVAEAVRPNQQVAFGRDVITRMQVSLQGQAKEVRAAGTATLCKVVDDLLCASGREVPNISSWGVAANTPLSYLMTGRSVASLLQPPFRLDDRFGRYLPGSEIGLDLAAQIFVFPVVNPFVGGDLVAFLSAQAEQPGTALFIDFGTNAEIALCHEGHWWVTSAAAGPAFEGGDISSGRLYGPGSVEAVQVVGRELQLSVVGKGSPLGLCGTGLADLIAAGLNEGLIDASGGLREAAEVASELYRYLARGKSGPVLRYHHDARGALELTQADIRAFQYAKAAVKAGVVCLLDRAGLRAGQVLEVFFTGAFGNGLSHETLKTVAMLPESMVEKTAFIAEGVLLGIGKFLHEDLPEEELNRFARLLRPCPLSGTPQFQRAFLEAMNFS